LALVLATSAVARDGIIDQGVERASPLEERAGSGTLPLRLRGGEGTLPLRFEGRAVDLASNQTVDTTLLLTTVTQSAMPAGQGAAVSCQLQGERITKHAATGNLAIAGSVYGIRGICYDADSQNMEIVAAVGGNRSFLLSRLPGPQPRALSGRLTVQAAGNAAGRYSVSLRSNDAQPQ
jgi:hypothetical protein